MTSTKFSLSLNLPPCQTLRVSRSANLSPHDNYVQSLSKRRVSRRRVVILSEFLGSLPLAVCRHVRMVITRKFQN